MSFTIGRTYTLVAGRDYSGKNNQALKFKATITEGSTAINYTVGRSDVTSRYTSIAGVTGGTPAISAPGFPRFTGLTGLTAGTTGKMVVYASAPSTISGEYECSIYDSSIPSSEDSPVLQIHIIDTPGAFVFKTLTGQSVTLPAGSLAKGGIYEYGISTVTSIGTTGTILGLAPALKPFIV